MLHACQTEPDKAIGSALPSDTLQCRKEAPMFSATIQSLLTPTHGSLLAEGASSAGGLGGMLPILLMFGVVYFIVLRPMSKQEKDRRKRVDGIKKGDQVVLGGGILGRISNADDPKICVVEIADRVKVKVLRKDISDLQASALADDKDPKAKDGKAKDKDAKSASSGKAKDEGGKAAKDA